LKTRFSVILSVLIGAGLLTVLLAGGNILRRDTNRTARNNTTQQARNLSQIGMNGPSPMPSPNARNIAGNNNKGLGNTSPNIMNIGAQPSPTTDNIQNIRKGITNNSNNINNNAGTNNVKLDNIAQQMGYNSEKADGICNKLDNIGGIDNVNAVVCGNTALVGYDSANKNADIGATKNMICDRVKQMDNTITNVVVTDSKDLSSRIGNLAGNIKSKKSTTDLNNEFNRIMQSINPAGNVFTR
jgi:spore cortex protein